MARTPEALFGLLPSVIFAALFLCKTQCFAQPATLSVPQSLHPPELILKNGKIYTDHDAGKTWSQAVSIRDGVFLSIGSNAAVERERGPATKIIDLKGRVVVPGFNDSQVHFLTGGLQLLALAQAKPGVLNSPTDVPSESAMKLQLEQAFERAQSEANQFGITSIQGGPIRGEDEVRIIYEFYKKKNLHVRYAMWGDIEKPQNFLTLKEKYKDLPEEWASFAAVKGVIDGSIQEHTAALQAPYFDDRNNSGEPRYSQERLNELVIAANRLGLPVVLHAAGDKAVGMAMTALIQAKRYLFNSRLRNRIECLESVPSHLVSWFAENNVTVSIQPGQVLFKDPNQNYFEKRLGRERARHTLNWRTLLRSRARLAFGTDWPVQPLNPLLGIYGAVFRLALNERPIRWPEDQRISLDQAIEAYSLSPAYATHEDHVKGTIREGKYADLVVLSSDPFKSSPGGFLKMQPYITIVGGQIVNDNSQPRLEPAKKQL